MLFLKDNFNLFRKLDSIIGLKGTFNLPMHNDSSPGIKLETQDKPVVINTKVTLSNNVHSG